jgi:RimJ/RimL family protein N-acetyltransferase
MEPTEISCGHLYLRPWSEYDEEAVLEACQDADVQRWTSVPSPYSREDAHAGVTERAPGGWRAGTAATWAVLDATTGELLASVGLHGIADGHAELGYWCTPAARGRGVVSEAVAAVCRWGFGALDLERITWDALVGNHASLAVAQKCGFTVEGLRRRAVSVGGPPADAWVGSLLADDPVVDRRPLPAPPTLTDGVVTLRPWTAADVPDVAKACDDPLTARRLPVPSPYTPADATWFVSDHVPTSWLTGDVAELAVTDAVTGELLGAMGLKLLGRRLGYGEVGYWTAPWARGRGVAARGAVLSARWGLDVLGLDRVELLADVENPASQRVAEKAGFVREGVARRGRLDRDRVAQDMVVFSLVRGG